MSQDAGPWDVELEVYLEGVLVHRTRLDPAAVTAASAGAPAEPHGESPDRHLGPSRSRVVVVELPRDGRLRLVLDLRRPPPTDGRPDAGPHVTTFAYCGGKPLHSLAPGQVATYVYRAPAEATPPQPPEPPDEPHVTG